MEEAEEAREEANQIREGVEGVANATVELGERMEEMESRWRGHRREEEEDAAEELEWRQQVSKLPGITKALSILNTVLMCFLSTNYHV